MKEPRVVQAGNAGLFALGGTRTFLVGSRRVAIVDPGPDDPAHLDALAREVEGAGEGVILLTHRHPDHAAGAPRLAQRTGFPVRTGGGRRGAGRLVDGEGIPTDDGTLRAVRTPGHAPDHFVFLLEPQGVLLAGDLLLGRGSTTWVGEYAGCVGDYLASLDRVEALGARRILPAHGPPIEAPPEAIARYREHRLERVRQVRAALAEEPRPDPATDAGIRTLVERVYGPDLPAGVRGAAGWSVRGILEYLGAAPFPAGGGPMEGGDRLAPPSREG